MRDVFEFIDNLNVKFNIFREHVYFRKVMLVFAFSMIPVWLLLGWDSGVGVIEEAVKALPLLLGNQISIEQWINQSYMVYGRSFHFSSFTIYGLLFVGLSSHFEKLGFRGSKNVLYSAFLIAFNITVFELWYMASFAHYQMSRNILEWLISDLWFLLQYILIFVLGIVTLLAVWVDSFTLNSGKVVGRNFRFSPDKKLIIPIVLCLASITLWIYFPLSVEQATLADWTSSTLFPQTHYAYKDSKLYIANDTLHLVNIITKTMFAITQFYILSCWGKTND